jgi:hypothetical protein
MSMLRFNGIDYGTSFVDISSYGHRVWRGEVRTTKEAPIPIGSLVEIIMEEVVTFRGCVIRNPPFVGRGQFVVVGGGGGWRLKCAPTALRSDGGIRLATALDMLEQDVANVASKSGGIGHAESIKLHAGDKVLGKAWAPMTAAGSALIHLFGVPWFVGADGTTNVGYATTNVVPASDYAVQDVDAHGDNLPLAIRNGAGLAALVNAVKGSISGDPITGSFEIKTMRIVEEKTLRVTVYR